MFYKFAHFVVGALYHLLYRFRVVGRENIPQGSALVCVNHSSLADPIIIALALDKRDHPCFMAKAELFKIFGLKQLITWLGAFPVERGASDLGAIKATMKHLKNGRKVLIFPQGTRIVGDNEAAAMKSGAAMLASHSGAPLLPVYLSVGRKCFIDRIEVIIGKPFFVDKSSGGNRAEQHAEFSERLRKDIYSLKEQTVGRRSRK